MPEGTAPAPLRTVLGSTCQSVIRGSKTKAGFLDGEMVALGGRATPYNARLVQCTSSPMRTPTRPPEQGGTGEQGDHRRAPRRKAGDRRHRREVRHRPVRLNRIQQLQEQA
ncbi:hypothetical protein RxyAA322_27630 [Rubrobacter xylanophilus]|uniref:Uncharacterized protein n=1 Tax=Rubrobacter xylanophilus TaxID=49319 RepID=A0A510HLP2_9ACTN|nr:hypothetical protein RxyAA322_27630 [Rubrobacter xylanophilus]